MITVVLPNAIPYLLGNPNPKRTRILIQMRSTIVDANNTGNIKVSYNTQPNSGNTTPTTGYMLTQGAYIINKDQDGTMPPAAKGQIWLLASAADQSIDWEEDVSE